LLWNVNRKSEVAVSVLVLMTLSDPETWASELILEWGGRRGEARRAESRGGVLGEGTASPSPPTRGFAGAV